MSWKRVAALLAAGLSCSAFADDRLQALEAELARLKAENDALKAQLSTGAPPQALLATDGGQGEAPAEENLLANIGEGEAPSQVGSTGSFGSRLEQLVLQFDPFLHAYATMEFVGAPQLPNGQPNPKAWSFDPRYFNIFVGGTMGPVHAELQLELEHGTEVAARFAQVDFEVDPRLVFRVGIFLVPFGLYNEYYYPEYVRPLPRRPLAMVLDQVIPVVWNDVGVQVRGRGNFTQNFGWNYALYVGNGLNLAPGGNSTNFRNMRGNYVESLTSNKALGGRLGLNYLKFNLGVSGNNGAYTDNPNLFLTFVGADASWEDKWWGVMCEYVWSRVMQPSGAIYHRWGVSLQGHYAILEWLRVGLMADLMAQPDENPLTGQLSKVRLAPVIAFYPAPKLAVKTSIRFAYARSFVIQGTMPSDEVIYMAQVAAAF